MRPSPPRCIGSAAAAGIACDEPIPQIKPKFNISEDMAAAGTACHVGAQILFAVIYLLHLPVQLFRDFEQ